MYAFGDPIHTGRTVSFVKSCQKILDFFLPLENLNSSQVPLVIFYEEGADILAE